MSEMWTNPRSANKTKHRLTYSCYYVSHISFDNTDLSSVKIRIDSTCKKYLKQIKVQCI